MPAATPNDQVLAAILIFFGIGATQTGPRGRWFVGGTFPTLFAYAVILIPLSLSYEIVAEGSAFRKQLFETASRSLKMVAGQPVLTGVAVNGGEATLTLKPLPMTDGERHQIIDDVQKSSRLQITLVDGN